jgi:outer membrane receptor protein involved in Fe transport
VALEPEAIRGLQASLDYVVIKKSDDIVSPADLAITDFAVFEQRHPERVTRAAVTPGDPYGVGMITAIDASHINVAQAKIRAWDLFVRYQLEPDWTIFRRVDFTTRVTYQPEFSTRATPDSPPENDAAVTADSPLRLGAVGGMTFIRGPAKFSWTTRYFGSYQVSRNSTILLNQGGRKIGHQTYHDMALSYELPLHWYQLDGIDLQASVQNVFDKEPPFDAGSFSYFSPFGDARGAVYSLTFTARF